MRRRGRTTVTPVLFPREPRRRRAKVRTECVSFAPTTILAEQRMIRRGLGVMPPVMRPASMRHKVHARKECLQRTSAHYYCVCFSFEAWHMRDSETQRAKPSYLIISARSFKW